MLFNAEHKIQSRVGPSAGTSQRQYRLWRREKLGIIRVDTGKPERSRRIIDKTIFAPISCRNCVVSLKCLPEIMASSNITADHLSSLFMTLFPIVIILSLTDGEMKNGETVELPMYLIGNILTSDKRALNIESFLI